MDVGIQNLDVRVRGDIARLHLARLFGIEKDCLGMVHVELERDLLQVHDDVRSILGHVGNRGELVQHPFNLDRCDGRSFDRRKQHATQGIADRGAKTPFKGLSEKMTVCGAQRFQFTD